MSFVEYCDNRNCRLNSEFKCSAEEVEFNEYAECDSAQYNDSDLPSDTPPDSSQDRHEPPPSPSKSSDDKWLKYI